MTSLPPARFRANGRNARCRQYPGIHGPSLWYKGNVLSAARRLVAAPPGDNVQTAMFMRCSSISFTNAWGAIFARLSGLPDVEAPRAHGMGRAPTYGGSAGKLSSAWFMRLAYRSEIDIPPSSRASTCRRAMIPRKRIRSSSLCTGCIEKILPDIDWLNSCSVMMAWPIAMAHCATRMAAATPGIVDMGDADVLHCIALARERCDRSRPYLLDGVFHGGAGVWHIGAAHPELFAALAPFFGGRDPQVTSPQSTLDALTPREKRYADKDSSFAQCDSLLTTPVFVCQGDQDPLSSRKPRAMQCACCIIGGMPSIIGKCPARGMKRR